MANEWNGNKENTGTTKNEDGYTRNLEEFIEISEM
jgi:hypothetical protein